MNKAFYCLRLRIIGLLVCILFVFAASLTYADAPLGQPYTFQVDDTLGKLAEKFLMDVSAWPAILVATNAKADESSQFRKIFHPRQLQAGQLLWIPASNNLPVLMASLEARPQLQPLTKDILAEFEDHIETTRVRYGIPGAAVVLVRGNEIVFANGFGVRQVGQSDLVTPETIFPIGSTTKALNAMMIARLVDQGRLNWDQPVLDIWPDFALSDLAQTGRLRMRDLLNMGSGLPRRDLVWSGAALTPEELMGSLVDLPIYAEIGDHYYYNNQLVATAGYVAAMAAGGRYGQLGQDYADQLQAQVFDPIGMGSATTSLEVMQAASNRAVPHDLNLFGQVVPTHYHEDLSIMPAGGVYANALDLAKFLVVQLDEGVTAEGQRIVSARNLRETQRPQTKITPTLSYGMGWFVEDFRGVDVIWHDGDVLGTKALIAIIPEADVGLVVLSNRIISLTFNSGVLYRLVELMYDLSPKAEQVYDDIWNNFQVNSAYLITSGISATVDPAEVANYVGAYEDGWRVELRGNRLYAVRGPYEWHLLRAEEGHFVVNNGYGIGMTLYLEEDPTSGAAAMKFTLSTGEPGFFRKLEEN